MKPNTELANFIRETFSVNGKSIPKKNVFKEITHLKKGELYKVSAFDFRLDGQGIEKVFLGIKKPIRTSPDALSSDLVGFVSHMDKVIYLESICDNGEIVHKILFKDIVGWVRTNRLKLLSTKPTKRQVERLKKYGSRNTL